MFIRFLSGALSSTQGSSALVIAATQQKNANLAQDMQTLKLQLVLNFQHSEPCLTSSPTREEKREPLFNHLESL